MQPNRKPASTPDFDAGFDLPVIVERVEAAKFAETPKDQTEAVFEITFKGVVAASTAARILRTVGPKHEIVIRVPGAPGGEPLNLLEPAFGLL